MDVQHNSQRQEPEPPPSSRPRDLRRIESEPARKPSRNPRGRPFPPGNPGRVPGARNEATALVECILAERSEELVHRVVDLALAGNPTALRFCGDRIVPRRSRTAPFELPEVATSDDVVAAMKRVSALIAGGNLEAAQGLALAKALDRQYTLLRAAERAERVERAARPKEPSRPAPLADLSDAELAAALRSARRAADAAAEASTPEPEPVAAAAPPPGSEPPPPPRREQPRRHDPRQP